MAESNPDRNRLKPAHPRKWLWRLIAIGLASVVLIYFVPFIIAKTPLLDWAVRKGLSDLHGTVQISDASLGWFSPVELRGVAVREDDGQTVAEIGAVRSDRTLLSLMLDSTNVGDWKIDNAIVHLTWRGKSSNIEAVFDKYFYGPSTPTETGTAYRMHAPAAKAIVTDADTGRKWTVEPVDLTVAAQRDRRQPLSIVARGPVTEPKEHGVLALDIGISRTTPSTPFGVTTKVEAERGPLAAVNALVRRFQTGVHVDGKVSGSVDVKYVEEKQESVQVSGQAQASDFSLDAPQYLDETLIIKNLRLPLNLEFEGDRLKVASLNLQTDIGDASASGEFDLSKGISSALQRAGSKISVDVDLAGLAKLLPRTLHFRNDVRLTSGRLHAIVASTADANGVLWDGRITTSDLQGLRGNQVISWKQPLTVTLAARAKADSLPEIERLQCVSDFLQANVRQRGNNEYVLTATCEMSKLRQQLAQFVDVEGWLPDGQATATCTATRTGDRSFKIEGDAKVQQLQLRSASKRQWTEPEVVLKWAALVEPGRNGLQEARAGAVTFQAGPVWIWASLHEPMPLAADRFKAHAKVRIHGELARWRTIAGVWLHEAEEWPVSGVGEISGRIRFEAGDVEFHDLKAEYANFRLAKFGLNIAEPKATFLASGRRDAKSGRFQLLDASLTCPTLTVSMPAASFGFDSKGNLEASGKGSIRGDVAKLERWFRTGNEASQLAGTFSGSWQAFPAGGATNFSVDATAGIVSASNPPSRESKATFSLAGSFDAPKDSLRFEKAVVDAAGLRLQTSGAITALATRPVIQLRGQLDYDWEKLEPQIRSLIGPTTKIAGRGSRPIRLDGTLAAPIQLTGELGAGWDSLQAFGCNVGPVQLDLQFTGKAVEIKPIQTTLNQGRAYAAPAIRLDPSPSELSIAKGSGVQRAKLTQAMCDELLGYAAPALARSTDADGEVTVYFSGGRVPLDHPEKADAAGQIILHSVRIAATSPMLRLLSTVLQTPASVALQKEAVVNFRVADGRVYHDKLELVFPGLTIKMSGSVGFDGTLNLMIETPMPPRWLPNVPWKDTLAKQPIKIPLRGTLSKPQLDEEAIRKHLADITRDAARGAASDALRKEVEKGFEKLFPPKK